MKIVNALTFLSLSTIASAKRFKGRKLPNGTRDPDQVYNAAKKGGSGGYGSKKGFSYPDEPTYDECITGKKGSYTSGKKGYEGKGGGKGYGDIEIPDYGDSCMICDKQNKNRPSSLVLQYVAEGANSAFQPSGKASCREGQYPSPARITVNGASFDVVDGDMFEIFPDGGAETCFHIVPTGQDVYDEDIDCYIHTSCSVPIVVGDQIGPFLIEGNEDCEPPEEPECPPCQVCDDGRPDLLNLRYHSLGKDSTYQLESKASCRAGYYPTDAIITVEGQQFDLSDGDNFTIVPKFGSFSAHTDFHFYGAEELDCDIHTSCSVPLMPGDQIGPFEIIGDDDCPDPKPTIPPTPAPLECINAMVGTNEDGDTYITVELNYNNLSEDRTWAENCDNRDPVCPNFDLTPLSNDWVGFYPCSEKTTEPMAFQVEPEFWAYTCYERDCRTSDTPTSEATIVFADETMPAFGRQGIHTTIAALEAQGGGCYVVLLNKYEGFSAPPYYNLCLGNEIMLPDKSR